MIIVPHTPPSTTVRSRALADALRATIADFRRREPKLTDAEIEGALSRAHESIHTRDVRRRRAIVGAVAGLGCVAGAIVVAAAQPGLSTDPSFGALVAGGIVLVGVVVVLLLRHLNNS